ncbi:MAG: CBS domain-containing protein [Bacteroidales bacterium]|nr:CBS domain-containing protein [Bacteroidales bacterium]
MKPQQKPSSVLFMEIFAEIEQKLKSICGVSADDYLTFSEMLRLAQRQSHVVQQYANDLREYAQLRNAIVHTRRQDFIIAEPHDEVVRDLRHILRLLNNPPRVASVMHRRPYFATPSTNIITVIEAFSQHGFLRCPIVDGGRIVGLMNSKSISRWLAAHNQSRIDLGTSTVSELVPFAEPDDYQVMAERDDLLTLTGLFKNSIKNGRYIQAVLVTRNGRPDGGLVGIITPSDLPTIFERLDNA